LFHQPPTLVHILRLRPLATVSLGQASPGPGPDFDSPRDILAILTYISPACAWTHAYAASRPQPVARRGCRQLRSPPYGSDLLLRSRASLSRRPSLLDTPEHLCSSGTRRADETSRSGPRRTSQVPRLAGPSRRASPLASGPQCMGRPCRPLTGPFPTRSGWARPDVSATHPAFFSNRRSLQGLPHKQVI